jgi:hypothetical protein
MLAFQVLFAQKCIKIIYIFYFLKFIFDIRTSKQFKNTNKKLILSQKKFKFWANNILAAMPNTPRLVCMVIVMHG